MRLSLGLVSLVLTALPLEAQDARVTFADGHVLTGAVAFATGFHTGTNGMRYYKDPSDFLIFTADGSDAPVKVPIERLRSVAITYSEHGSLASTILIERSATVTLTNGNVVKGHLPAIDQGVGSHSDYTVGVKLETEDLVVKTFELQDFASSLVPRIGAGEQITRIDFIQEDPKTAPTDRD